MVWLSFFDGVPLVDHHHAGAAVFLDAPGNALILLGDAVRGRRSPAHRHRCVSTALKLRVMPKYSGP